MHVCASVEYVDVCVLMCVRETLTQDVADLAVLVATLPGVD